MWQKRCYITNSSRFYFFSGLNQESFDQRHSWWQHVFPMFKQQKMIFATCAFRTYPRSCRCSGVPCSSNFGRTGTIPEAAGLKTPKRFCVFGLNAYCNMHATISERYIQHSSTFIKHVLKMTKHDQTRFGKRMGTFQHHLPSYGSPRDLGSARRHSVPCSRSSTLGMCRATSADRMRTSRTSDPRPPNGGRNAKMWEVSRLPLNKKTHPVSSSIWSHIERDLWKRPPQVIV